VETKTKRTFARTVAQDNSEKCPITGNSRGNEAPVVTVIGKAFWDIGHAPKDQSKPKKEMPEYAVREIRLVMKVDVR
jgi:hypothetical protein